MITEQRLQEISDHTSAILQKGRADDEILLLGGFVLELVKAMKGRGRADSGNLRVFEIPEGTSPSKCRSCEDTIYWVETKKKKRMPLNEDGTSHFSTCPQAQSWRK